MIYVTDGDSLTAVAICEAGRFDGNIDRPVRDGSPQFMLDEVERLINHMCANFKGRLVTVCTDMGSFSCDIAQEGAAEKLLAKLIMQEYGGKVIHFPEESYDIVEAIFVPVPSVPRVIGRATKSKARRRHDPFTKRC